MFQRSGARLCHERASSGRSRVIRFGVFDLDLRAGELRKRSVKVQEQPLQLLQILLENPGEVATREELQQNLAGGHVC